MTTAYLGLGSNLGDRLANLRRGVDLLAAFVEVVAASPVVESRAVGMGEDAPDFLNAAVACRTGLVPEHLLRRCHEVEEEAGRVRRMATDSRILDVDLLFFGHEVRGEVPPVLPHPRWKERSFVLLPLLHVAPDLRDPVSGQTVRAICREREDLLSEASIVAPSRAILPSSDPLGDVPPNHHPEGSNR